MPQDRRMTRREFVRRGATAAAAVGAVGAPAVNVLGANEMLNVGLIGPGIRGVHLMRQMKRIEGVRITAIADIYDGWRARGVEMAKETAPEVKAYDHYKKILEDRDLDALVIATPEHAHCRMLIDALEAGYDVYCEKPMVHTWKEGQAVVRANQKAKRIVQIGTQRRSTDIYHQAAQIVQSGGIGQVTQVRAFWYRNTTDDKPQWRYPIPEDASEDNINWDAFHMGARKHPFDIHRYFQWRCYWDYSMGIGGDLMVHQVDIINMVMGSKMPSAVTAMGKILRFHELGRETPDTWNAILEYPEGFYVNYNSIFSNEHYGFGEQFLGQSGTIEIVGDSLMRIYPEKQGMKQVEAQEVEAQVAKTKPHLENFFDCVRTREQPNCDEVQGCNAATAAHMSVLSHLKGKIARWDDEKQQVVI